jgi:hypothetical protein
MSRSETYERRRQDGSVIVITRDMDTGEKSIKVKGAVEDDVPMTDAEKARAAERAANANPGGNPPGDAPERPSRGASLASWAEFAKAVKFEHADGATRDEIRDAYEAAHPVE